MSAIIASGIAAIGGFFKGGVIGVAASLIQKWLANKEAKASKDKEVEIARLAVELAKATGNANALIETIKAESAMRTASYEHDTKTLDIGKGIKEFFASDGGKRSFWGYLLFGVAFMLDFVRGSLRPAMCYIYTGLAVWVVVYGITVVGVSREVLQDCVKYGLYAAVEMAGAIVGWYFGLRQDDKKLGRK
jgi:hypothetical protein